MWPDRVSNPGSLVLESDALPTAPRGPARKLLKIYTNIMLLVRMTNLTI